MSTLTNTASVMRAAGPNGSTSGPLSIKVNVHCDDGCWWAESPQLPGLSIAEDSFESLASAIRPAIEYYIEETPSLQGRHIAIRMVQEYTTPMFEEWKDARTA